MEVFRGEEKEDKKIRRLSDSSKTRLHPLTKIPQKISEINLFSTEFRNILVTENNAERIFKSFIKENKDFFGVDPEELKLTSMKNIRGKWYAKFQQIYKGITVYKATLGLDANEEGKMGSYSSNYHPKIDAPTESEVALENAVKTALNTYEDEDRTKIFHKNAEKIIYPSKEDEKISYHLAWKFLITTEDQDATLEKYFIVDAIDGKILESYPARFPGAKIHGQVRGEIYPENPGDAIATRPLEDEYVEVHTLGNAKTDLNGNYEKTVPWYWPLVELFSSPECIFELIGPHARVQNHNGANYRFSRNCSTSSACNHTWTAADRDHINMFYHLNLFHDWLMSQLGYNWWNSWTNSHRFNARVNYSYNNAFAGDPLDFGNDPYARSCDVIYHECSHNVLYDLFDGWIGFSVGRYNEGYAMDEGFSDYFACACTNDSEHGEGTGSPRDLDNNLKYIGKAAYNLEGHSGGPIIGGAAWDIRQAMIDKLGTAGAKFADQLIFDALQILATYPSNYYFSDPHESNLLSAIYLADDDNNNLVDGVPHFKIIHDAFRKHNLLQAILDSRDSFDFSCNLIGQLTGGDLYYYDGKFWANNLHQRGVKDLGDIGNVALEDVNITSGGYTRFGVDVIVGHTYISLAHEGEEGNHIVFRVLSLAGDNSDVTIEYCYKEPVITFNVHQIKKYNYSFDARAGGPGRLQLWGEKGLIAEISFVADDAPVPPPQIWPNLTGANAFFKRSNLLGLIDMLRNEGPVSLTVNKQEPGFVFVHTGIEPVSEGES